MHELWMYFYMLEHFTLIKMKKTTRKNIHEFRLTHINILCVCVHLNMIPYGQVL